ncbi:Der GTPase-activating protein YihI [Thalassotalea sediminis]|uniref:Der GTPase-activating protein YihI n=1 Tax=Thalassotalea sediminis TaxID=1759089 RepID=UPI0025744BFF|nr:Der GTPase-activating protein YihI [Thalassotalea sediminis]
MTRKKKSRTSSAAPVRLSKQEKQKLAELKDKKPKKQKGKKPGNRQQVARENTSTQQPVKNNDPRLGSKKPIPLGKTTTTAPTKKVQQKPPSAPRVAPVHVIDNTADLNDELISIEEDEMLQAILVKQDQALPLSEQEIEYFNRLMDRHHVISEQLGLSDEVTEDNNEAKDDDALWDSLDKQDFSDYQ